MRVHQNTWGRVSQVQKLGHKRYVVACAWQGMENSLEMLVGAQLNLPKSTAHAWRFSHPNAEADDSDIFGDVTDVLLMYIKGGYKSECTQDLGFFLVGLVNLLVFSFGLFPG